MKLNIQTASSLLQGVIQSIATLDLKPFRRSLMLIRLHAVFRIGGSRGGAERMSQRARSHFPSYFLYYGILPQEDQTMGNRVVVFLSTYRKGK